VDSIIAGYKNKTIVYLFTILDSTLITTTTPTTPPLMPEGKR